MVDYYKILDVAITAKEEEIKGAIKDKRRLWMQKTNAPQLERRQEAEVKVKQIDEAEKILLNSTQRSTYDQKLKTTATKDERTINENELKGSENLVEQGWKLLINDEIADAIYVATKATEKQGDNPEAWALLAQAKYRWGEIEDALYEYKKAIKLKPNEPDYYFDIDDLLFDNSNPDELQKIVDIELRAAIDTWVPTVSVLSVKYKNFNQTIENNQIEFDVVFALKNDLSKKETLNLTYNTQAP